MPISPAQSCAQRIDLGAERRIEVDPLLSLGEKDRALRLQRVRVRQHVGDVVLGLLRKDGLGAGRQIHPRQPRRVDAHAGQQVGRRAVPAEAVDARRHEILAGNVKPGLVAAGRRIAKMDHRAAVGVITTPPRTARSESMSQEAYPGLVSILSNAPVSRSRR